MQETQRYIRDLIWAVNSPALIAFTGMTPATTCPLSVNDVDREHLNNHFSAREERRVGRYFERLIYYWIRYIRRCEIVAQSLQIRKGKQTVGEIDLLFRDECGRLTHWELACKFYLQVAAEDASTTDYIGPNASDTLRKKVIRLQEHQLPLGVQYFPEADVRDVFVKGRIFYHCQTGARESLPSELTADHLDGKWIRVSEIPELLRNSRMRYRILQKPFWLAEDFASPSDDDIFSADELSELIQDHFRDHRTPILLSEFCESALPLYESERWFVVSDEWPD